MRTYLLTGLTIAAIPFMAVFGLALVLVAIPFALYDLWFGDRRTGYALNSLLGLHALAEVVTDRDPAAER
jgi:hypothetical protein